MKLTPPNQISVARMLAGMMDTGGPYTELLRDLKLFFVQHDWRAAFVTVPEGDLRAPFPNCGFVFGVDGESFVVFTMDDMATVFVCKPAGPLMMMLGKEDPIGKWLTEQVRCVLVALDAEVVSKRESATALVIDSRGARPQVMKRYVLTLHGRQVGTRSENPPSGRSSPCLHVRRGHWKHQPYGKVWSPWTLVGDPDVGRIDKDYRI